MKNFDVEGNVDETISSINLINGLETGYRELDKITGGFQNSDMIVLASRPGVGKTTFVLNMAYNMCVKNDKSVLFFSLEMSGKQLIERVLSPLHFVASNKISSGELNDNEIKSLINGATEIMNKKFFINDNSLLTIADLKNKCIKLKQSEYGLDIVFIDYLQLITFDNKSPRNHFKSRQEEVSAISKSIKELAKELNIPIVVMSQLNREADSRSGPPQFSDLRESSALEQDADVIIFIHKSNDEDKQAVELIVAKNNNGDIGSVKLSLIKEFQNGN